MGNSSTQSIQVGGNSYTSSDDEEAAKMAAFALLASTASKIYLGGRQQRNAYKIQEAQLKTQKKAIETNAAIENEERLLKLKETIAMQNAVFAMGGQSAGVGSAGAIQMASMSEANRERRLQNLQTDVSKSSLDFNILSAKKASKNAMFSLVLSTGLDSMQKASQAYLEGYYKKKK